VPSFSIRQNFIPFLGGLKFNSSKSNCFFHGKLSFLQRKLGRTRHIRKLKQQKPLSNWSKTIAPGAFPSSCFHRHFSCRHSKA
jgi:hypothetical protein